MRLRSVAPAIVALVVALAGCGDDPQAPQTSAPDGFSVVRDAEAGFAVAVPATWQQVPLSDDPATFDRTANRLRLQNPKLASALVQARLLAQGGGRLVAVRPDGAASINLTVDKAKEKTLDEVSQKSVAALLEAGATGMLAARPTVAGGPAVRLTFRLPVETDAGTVEVGEVQYYLLRDGHAFILTVMGADEALAAAVAETLRVR